MLLMGSVMDEEDVENIGNSIAESLVFISVSIKYIYNYIYEKCFV